MLLLCAGLLPTAWGLAAIVEDLSSHDDWLDGLGAMIGAIAVALGVTVSGVSACALAWPAQTWRVLRCAAPIVVLPVVVLLVLGTVLP